MTLSGKRVLVVEDEAIICLLLEEFLEELGCHVVAIAARLDDALEKARTLAVDIAVLDISLDGKQSYSVADILRARNIPFVFATGYDMPGLSADLQGTLVLAKPFQQAQLADVLHTALGCR